MKITKRKDGWWIMETKWVMVGASNPLKLIWEYITFRLARKPALIKREGGQKDE